MRASARTAGRRVRCHLGGARGGYRRGVFSAVVLLPDSVLLVPGAAGRADPAAGLRTAAVDALRAADPGPDGRVLVLAPGTRDRELTHPVGLGLGAAGLPQAPGRAVEDLPPALRADVPASTALVLLDLAGCRGPVDVRELARTGDPTTAPRPAADDALPTTTLVVVGSPSARHGVDAPLAEDPRAAEVDADLIAALGDGPAALAVALDALGPETARELAVSGWAPWRAAVDLLAGDAPALRAVSCTTGVVAGAQHVVARWGADPAPRPHHLEEPR